MKSYIKSKKPIKFGKIITVDDLIVNKDTLKDFEEGIKRSNPNISEEKLKTEVHDMILKDNYYNRLMDEVSSAYEFELDQGELEEKVSWIKRSHPDISDEYLSNMAKVSIIKQLIYDDLSRDWELEVSDKQVTETLQNFYKSTGQPIREYLTDKNKFNDVKRTLKEQIISERLLNAFKLNFLPKKNEKS